MKLSPSGVPWLRVVHGFLLFLLSVTRGSGGRQGHFRAIPYLTNYIVMDSALWVRWNVPGETLCAMVCLADVSCGSFFYNRVTGSCLGHHLVFTSTASAAAASGTVYYKRDVQADQTTVAPTTTAATTTAAPTTTTTTIATPTPTTTTASTTTTLPTTSTTTTTTTTPTTTTTTTAPTTTTTTIPTTTATTTTNTAAPVTAPVTYTYHVSKKHWNGARTTCIQNGGDMASLDTQERFDAVKKFLNNRRSSGKSIANSLWVGIIRSSTDGQFYWTNGALMDNNDKWTSGYPRAGQSCGYTSFFNGMKYLSYTCSTFQSHFLCQTPA